MPHPAFDLDSAVFTYMIAPRPLERFSRHTPVLGGALTVSHTSKTEVRSARKGEREIAVIGLCVDAHGEAERDDIPGLILAQPLQDIRSVYRFCDRFAGNYVILYQNGSDCYVLCDATASMQVNYSFLDGSPCLSSVDRLIAGYLGLKLSPYSLKIRRGGIDLSQALPNDITMFDGVKVLLPNHYLDLSQRQAVRVPAAPTAAAYAADAEETARISAVLIRQIVREYGKYYDMVCPLTAGYDSRVVLSFLRNAQEDVNCYTFRHPGFSEKTADLQVPEQICRDLGVPYCVIKDLTPPEEYVRNVCEVIGRYHSAETIGMAYTYNTKFLGKALINGDIIGQCGKSSKGKDIPSSFANAMFFLSKIHNKERLALQEMKKYISEVRAAGEGAYIFDLFATEIMNGRWSGQGHTIYSICSLNSLNIFNCRELILRWMEVPRNLRMTGFLHRSFLKENSPELLEYPFNPGGRYAFLKKSWLTYYLGSHAKLLLWEKPGFLPKAEDLWKEDMLS